MRFDHHCSFLRRLARDARGNTIAIMAAAMIPMLAFAGSAVDTARLYVVKTRLQQACDAGVLAGRKTMDQLGGATLDANATTQAKTFFANNFSSGYMGTPAFNTTTTPYPFTPTKTSEGQVSGTATTQVPMTLMKMFGSATQPITVTCEARFDVADTDIVFVLDTTGSMACLPSDTDATCTAYVNSAGTTSYTRPADSSLGAATGVTGSANDSVAGYPGSTGYAVPENAGGSRIAALRQAVVNFYKTVDTNKDPQTRVRYGFVTYSSSVNAGEAIMSVSPSYMVGGSGSGTTNWTYQSRFINPDVTSQYQVSSSSAYDATPQASCNTSTRTPAAVTGQPYTFDTSSRASVAVKAWDSAASGSNKCKVTTTIYGPLWTYGPASFDVRNYLTSASVDDPSKLDGTTNSWQGCIEERDTTPGVSSFSTTSLPGDLDPDLIPSSLATQWRPAWPEVAYWRNYVLSTPQSWYGSTANVMDVAGNAGDTDKSAFYSSSNVPNALSLAYYNSSSLLKGGNAACGKPVRRVSTMTLQDVTNYVNATDFKPLGGTYHDTGMIWGTRLLSTKGIFKGDVAPAVTGRPATNKVIVFLTDGAMSPSLISYGMYGMEYFDKRVTNGDYAPPAAASPNTQQTAYHNARFLAECDKAKSMNVKVWTVMITTNTTPTTQLSKCATTTSQALVSSSGSDLNTKFQAIAKQIAMLRISQ